MAFEVRDYYDFVRLLYQHPEWQEELGNLLIAKEICELPQIVRELAEAQQRGEERLTRLEQAVAELTEAQKRTEQRVEELAEAQKRTEQRVEELAEAQKRTEQRVEELAEAQKRTEQRVEELAEAQKRTEQRVEELAEAQKRTDEQLRVLTQRVDELTEAQKRTEQRLEALAKAQEKTEKKVQDLIQQVNSLTGQMGNIRGELLEIRYHQRAFSFFGQLASRLRVVDLQEVWPELEERLSEEELSDLLALDMLLQGRMKRSLEAQFGRSEVWLAVEISGVVDANDVERVRHRADLLQKAGLPVLAVAAGSSRTKGAGEKAKELGVIVQRDGVLEYLQEALAHWAGLSAKSD